MIRADVVDSDISLRLSKDSMKKAKIKVDLENDQAVIFEKFLIWIVLLRGITVSFTQHINSGKRMYV